MSDFTVTKERVPEAQESRQPTLVSARSRYHADAGGGRAVCATRGLSEFGVDYRALRPRRACVIKVGHAVRHRSPAPLVCCCLHRQPAASARADQPADVDQPPPVLVGDCSGGRSYVAEPRRLRFQMSGGPRGGGPGGAPSWHEVPPALQSKSSERPWKVRARIPQSVARGLLQLHHPKIPPGKPRSCTANPAKSTALSRACGSRSHKHGAMHGRLPGASARMRPRAGSDLLRRLGLTRDPHQALQPRTDRR